MEDEHRIRIPTEAKNYYTGSIWWSQQFGDLMSMKSAYFAAGRNNLDYNNSKEIVTPEVSDTWEEVRSLASSRNRVVNDISEGGEGDGGYGNYSRQMLSSEIVELVEDGSKSITSNKDRRVDDLYVAVGRDDMDVVKWALDHAVSPGARIFLVHVSPPITLIPTPVGKFSRSQLSPQQVRLYVNEENNRRKDMLQKYIQLSNEAEVTAEALLLESKDTGKAILDLISILNITNLVIGIKKPPCSRRNNNKSSKGEFVKKNAPAFCEVTLVYDGNEFVTDPYRNGWGSQCPVPQSKVHSKWNFFDCICFSGCVGEVKDN